jgi:hypothetical protein
MDLDLLREREDKGVAAVRDLKPSEQWAALQMLIFALNLRLTQVDIAAEKLRAFKRENAG